MVKMDELIGAVRFCSEVMRRMEPSRLSVIDEATTECKGLFWRGSVSSYLSSHNSIEVRKSLRFLKKMSCRGCSKCEWLYEHFSEDICSNFPNKDYLGDIKHGALYTYQISTSRVLYDEIDNIDFVEVKEGEK